MVNFEYAFVWAGQENGRPFGTKAQGFVQAPHLDLSAVGIDLVNLDVVTGTGTEVNLTLDTVLVKDRWIGAKLFMGSPGVPLVGYGEVISNAAGTISVKWTEDVTASVPATFSAYLVREDYTAFPEVRVLVPYQPEGPDTIVNVISIPYDDEVAIPFTAPPGFAKPAGVVKYEDWGLFLPFAFEEGIAGYGISHSTDGPSGGGAASAVDATSFTWTTALAAGLVDIFGGGYIHVTSGAALENESWARIQATGANTTTKVLLDSAGWLGFGTPDAGTLSTWKYEIWLPHWQNSPHSYIPGPGFRYPTNDMQPCVDGNGQIQNFPRGHNAQYVDEFGPMLEFGWRMASKLGHRVNMILLALNDTTLIPRTQPNVDGFIGTVGWYNHENVMSDWANYKTAGPADRLDKLITTIAPAALVAEASALTLRILGIVITMGESDAEITSGQQSYGVALGDFITWLRKVIDDASLSPYTTPAKVPVVHPLITADPWESAANDEDRLVNLAIGEIMEADGFGATIDPEDSTKLSGDTEHFDGKGEALNGHLISDAMLGLVNEALAYGSPAVVNTRKADVDICSEALSLIGETGITSLDAATDASTQADLCRTHYEPTRDALLQSRAWSFAMKRKRLIPSALTAPTSWLYVYVEPPDCLDPVAVLPEGVTDDYTGNLNPRTTGQWMSRDPGIHGGTYSAQNFGVERAPAGHNIILAKVGPIADLRYVGKQEDGSRFPPMFRKALARRLASVLAGPVLKGLKGAQLAERLELQANFLHGEAAELDADHRQQNTDQVVDWLNIR